MVSNAYLDGSYTEVYPDITEDEAGMKKLFKQFSFPRGIGSHAEPTVPRSIHEGGELGYALSHAMGAGAEIRCLSKKRMIRLICILKWLK